MDWWIFVVVALIVGPIIGGIFHSRDTANTFHSLGDIQGRPIDEIIRIVGQPNSISALPDTKSVYQWIQIVGGSSTHYAIIVDAEGNAEGYSHQSVF